MENECHIENFQSQILQGSTFLGVGTKHVFTMLGPDWTAAKSMQTLLWRHKIISFCAHSLEVVVKQTMFPKPIFCSRAESYFRMSLEQ